MQSSLFGLMMSAPGVALIARNQWRSFASLSRLPGATIRVAAFLSQQEKAERAESGFENFLSFLRSLLWRVYLDDWPALTFSGGLDCLQSGRRSRKRLSKA